MKLLEQIHKKYNNMNNAVKMSFWFFLCSFLQKGIGFITTPIFTRIMVDSEFGRYSLFNSWSSVVAVVVALSISGNCYTRGLIVNENDRDKFTSSLQGLVTTCIAVGCAFFLLFREQIQSLTGFSTLLIVLMFVELLLTNAYNFFYNQKRVEYDYRLIVILTLVFSFCRPVLSIIGIKLAEIDFQVEARVICIVIVNAVLFIPLFVRNFSKGKCFYNRDYWKYALIFCIPLIPHYLSSVVLNQADRIMIGFYIGDAEAGYYSVAYTLAGVMGFFNSAVAQSFDPWIYKSLKERNLKKIAPVSYIIILGIAAINVFVVAMAPEILRILAPARYSTALWVIPPVTASVFFTFMYNLFATFQFFYQKTGWIAVSSCIGAVLNVVLNAIFIPRFGFIAAGYTTLFCYIVFGIMHYFFMRKVCNKFLDGYKIYDAKVIFGIGAGLILVCGIVMLLYNHIVLRYILILCGLIVVYIKRQIVIDIVKEIKEN